MLAKLNSRLFATAVSVAAMTVGITVAQPAQKASAQVTLEGSGATSINAITQPGGEGSPLFFPRPNYNINYRSTGSGAGVNDFNNLATDFGAADILTPSVPAVIISPILISVGFPYNVPGLTGPGPRGGAVLNASQACGLVAGTITNWSEVGGPDLPVRRVFRSDVSGTSRTINDGFTVPICGFSILDEAGNVVLPNPNENDIGGNGSQGVIAAIQGNEGAVGYVDAATTAVSGLPLFFNEEFQTATLAQGPVNFFFRPSYDSEEKAAAARDLCTYLATDGQGVAASFGYDTVPTDSGVCQAISGPGVPPENGGGTPPENGGGEGGGEG